MEDGEIEETIWHYLAAFACAAFLTLAIVAPSMMSRTSWGQWDANGGTVVTDAPTGYVGLVTLSGIVALVALIASVWVRRVALAASLAAAAAFAFGTYVTAEYWLGFPRGERLLEGQANLGVSKVEVSFPPLLPVFTLVAAIGMVVTLSLALRWRRLEGSEPAR